MSAEIQKPKKKKRSYTPEQKARALAIVDISPSVSEAAKIARIPRQTLEDWENGIKIDDRVRQLRREFKNSQADAFEEVAWRYLERSRQQDAVDKTSGYYAVKSAREAVETARLLRGESTSIVETIEQKRERLAGLLSRAERLKAEETVFHAAEDSEKSQAGISDTREPQDIDSIDAFQE